jgi:hypothetical protein
MKNNYRFQYLITIITHSYLLSLSVFKYIIYISANCKVIVKYNFERTWNEAVWTLSSYYPNICLMGSRINTKKLSQCTLSPRQYSNYVFIALLLHQSDLLGNVSLSRTPVSFCEYKFYDNNAIRDQ